MSSVLPEIRCREIHAGEMSGVVLLLERGFPERDRAHWQLGLKRMTEHVTPPGFPKYGYLKNQQENAVLSNARHAPRQALQRCRVQLLD
jgi:hypothetical protein